MKLIQAMKQEKDLQRKAADLREKVGSHCADLSNETPVYGDNQRIQIEEWIQAHHDIVKEMLKLRLAIQRTNLATNVTIDLGGRPVMKSIAEWIHRRREFAGFEEAMYKRLGDRNLKEGTMKTSGGQEVAVTIRRYFDARARDTQIELYRSEPHIIDSTLEVINAITDVIEA